MNVLVVGAGIAGLSLGFDLLKLGANITLLEAGDIASGSSGAATAYMEPRLGKQPVRQVEWESLKLWPDYVAEIEDASDMAADFRSDGEIRVADESTLTRFENDIALRKELGWQFERLERSEIRGLEPALSGSLIAGIFLSQVCWIDGRKVCKALAKAIENLGGKIVTGFQVVDIESSTAGIAVTSKERQRIEAEKIVLCPGTGSIAKGLPHDIPRANPVRGVNLVLDMTPMSNPFKHLVKHNRGTLCPRSDNRLIAGTTYDRNETSLVAGRAVVETLYTNAETILPSIRDLPLVDVWCGLRPKVGDGQVSLGRSEINPDIFYSMGHAGAGYLRAPAIAKNMAKWILGDSDGGILKPLLKGF